MNELKNLDRFQAILQNYTVSEHARSILENTELLLLVGVTSAGRNSVVDELVKTQKYHYIVSDTTRKPRINHGQLEQNGREYWFRSEEVFLKNLQSGEYVEAAIIHNQQVSGISISEIELASREGKIATTDIEIVGVSSIVKAKEDTVCVFMIPPNFEEWLRRLHGRSAMHEIEVDRRLNSAITEITEALSKDCFTMVINDELRKTTKIIEGIFDHIPDQQHARQVAEELLKQTKSYLSVA